MRFAVHDDRLLFEFLILEGAQAGLDKPGDSSLLGFVRLLAADQRFLIFQARRVNARAG